MSNPYDIAEQIVSDMTDGDPLAPITEDDALQLIAEAEKLGYEIPDCLTPDLFVAIHEYLKSDEEE